MGAPADGEPEHVLHGAHWTARHHSLDLLAGIHGDRLIAVVGGRHDPLASGRLLLALFGPGPVVLGPAVPDLAARAPPRSTPGPGAEIAVMGASAAVEILHRKRLAAVPTGHTARR